MGWYKKAGTYTQAAVFVLLVGIIVRFALAYLATPSGDSAWHLAIAQYIAETGTIPVFEGLGRFAFWPPPLFHLIAAGVYSLFSIFGTDVALKSMQFVSPFFGSLTLVLFFLFVKNWLGEKHALYSTIFLSFIPFHIYYSSISHIGSMLTFFVILALYLLYKRRFWLSAIVCGLGVLTKYNMFFVFPVILYMIYKGTGKKLINTAQKGIAYFLLAFAVGIPWYIRNYVQFGNPIYTFLNPLFVKLGFPVFQYTFQWPGPTYTLNRFVEVMSGQYLDLFGIPLGDARLLGLFPWQPYSWLIWGLLTVAFFIPLLVGLYSKKKGTGPFLLWLIIPFLVMAVLYFNEYGNFYLRLIMPAILGAALLWGVGFDAILKARRRHKGLIVFLLLLVCFGFIGGEFVKTKKATDLRQAYAADYQWVHKNIPKDALVAPASGTMVYYTQRMTIPLTVSYDSSKVYYFVDKYSQQQLEGVDLASKELVYDSQFTEVKIYH